MKPLQSLLIALALAAPVAAQEGAAPAQQDPQVARVDDAFTKQDRAIVAIDEFIAGKGKPPKVDGWKQVLKKPPQVEFDPNANYFWHIETNKGPITIELMPKVAPMHVSSTIYLARTGFYDDITFHRVIKGFMAQGGDPLGQGMGGPGYSYGGEYDPEVKHDRPGILSMANTGQPNSDGSQFFLTFVPTPHLNGKHTVFGAVDEPSLKTLEALEACGSQSGQTSERLMMIKTWITVAPKETEESKEKADATEKPKD